MYKDFNKKDADFWSQAVNDYNNLWAQSNIRLNWSKKSIKGKVDKVLDKSNIEVIIDEQKQEVSFFTKHKTLIWEMFLWEFIILNERFPHCFLEIKEEFKWRWYWELLFNTYKDHFWALDLEYTKLKSKLKFFLKIWYIPYSKINSETWEEDLLYWNEEESLIAIEEWYIIKLDLE
jgi:hypothetical protein